MYPIRNCNKNTYMECTPETKPFQRLMTVIHTTTLSCLIIKQVFLDLLV